MKYYYRIIELLRPDNSEIGYRLAFKFASKLLIAVVSVHPMANEYLARILKEIDLPRRPKFVIEVTDPNSKLWHGWGCRGADLIIVPNELASSNRPA
jgi:hypothetical protein